MDKLVVIRVVQDDESAGCTLGGDVMQLLTGDDGSKYVGMQNGRIVLGDRAHAIKYRLVADRVEDQISDIKRLYGATWVAEEVTG